jgi:hypothetical protein
LGTGVPAWHCTDAAQRQGRAARRRGRAAALRSNMQTHRGDVLTLRGHRVSATRDTLTAGKEGLRVRDKFVDPSVTVALQSPAVEAVVAAAAALGSAPLRLHSHENTCKLCLMR